MNCEIVQEHEYQDIYRVKYGVLIIVNKFKRKSFFISKIDKKDCIKVTGIKNCYVINKDSITISRNEIAKKGSIILDNYLIEPLNDKSNFFIELKTTGSCFSGDLNEFSGLLDSVHEILNNYK